MVPYNKIKKVLSSLIHKKVYLDLPEAVISFTFDDAPNSAFTNGAQILKKYGYNGTYYISLGLLDHNRPEGVYFDTRHLNRIIADGGELACHTFNHIHFYNSKKKQIINDFKKNQKKITEFIPGHIFTNFSYPYGEKTIVSKKLIRNTYKSARSSQRGINFNYTDLSDLKAVNLENYSLNLDEIVAIIEKAIKNKGWLIFYTHNVEMEPSNGGCTLEYFESVVKYCYEKKIKVLTVENLLKTID